MRRMRAPVLVALLGVAACTGELPEAGMPPPRAEPPAPPASGADSAFWHVAANPIGGKLVQDIVDSPTTFVIGTNDARGEGLGRLSVKVGGKSLWPPEGNGCRELVACCDDIVKLEEHLALACLLAVGRDRDCPTALSTSRAIALESGVAIPPSCPH